MPAASRILKLISQVYISALPTSTCSPRPILFSLDITLHSRICSKPQPALQRSNLSGCTMRSSGRVCLTLTTSEINSPTKPAPRATRNRLSLHFGCLMCSDAARSPRDHLPPRQHKNLLTTALLVPTTSTHTTSFFFPHTSRRH